MRLVRLVLLASLSLASVHAAADPGLHVPRAAEVVPSLAVARDAQHPRRRTGMWVDALGVVRGEYRLTVLRSFAPRHTVAVSPSFLVGHGERGGGIDLAYACFLLGRGVEGPFVAGTVGGRTASVDGGARLRAGGELGYAYVLAGLVLGASVSALTEWAWQAGRLGPELRLRVLLGYAFF